MCARECGVLCERLAKVYLLTGAVGGRRKGVLSDWPNPGERWSLELRGLAVVPVASRVKCCSHTLVQDDGTLLAVLKEAGTPPSSSPNALTPSPLALDLRLSQRA